MKDNEIRGVLLQRYYDRRREQYIDIEPDELPVPITKDDILYVSSQLADHGLIEFKPALSGQGQIVAGRGHILAPGVDVVENEGAGAPIQISFDQSTNITVENSSNVQLGKGNIQGETINIQKLVMAIDDANASQKEKQEAKSKLEQFLNHPLVKAILGSITKTILP